jgi:hypothetical protein
VETYKLTYTFIYLYKVLYISSKISQSKQVLILFLFFLSAKIPYINRDNYTLMEGKRATSCAAIPCYKEYI